MVSVAKGRLLVVDTPTADLDHHEAREEVEQDTGTGQEEERLETQEARGRGRRRCCCMVLKFTGRKWRFLYLVNFFPAPET